MSDRSTHVPFFEKVGYSAADAAANFVFMTMVLFQTNFYTDTFGLTAGAAAAILLWPRLWDAFFDPIMGVLADRTETRWGKFRPWILWTALPWAVVMVLAYTTPKGWSMGALIAYAAITNTMLMTLYSMNNMPYSALGGVMTGDLKERTKLNSYRFVAVNIAQFIVGGLTLPLVAKFAVGHDRAHGWQMTMTVWAVICLVCFLITFFTTRERIKPVVETRASPKQDFADLLKNGPWLSLVAFTVFNFAMLSYRGGAHYNFYHHYADKAAMFDFVAKLGLTTADPNPQPGILEWLGYIVHGTRDNPATSNVADVFNSILNMAGFGTTVIVIILTSTLSNRFGKKAVIFTGFTLAGLNAFAYYLLAPTNTYGMLALAVLGSMFYAPTIAPAWAMYADAADYSEWQTGRRFTGMVFATIGFSLKAGLALGSAAFLWIMAGFWNYDTKAPAAENAIHGYFVSSSIVVGLMFVGAAVAIAGCKLNKSLTVQMADELADRPAQGWNFRLMIRPRSWLLLGAIACSLLAFVARADDGYRLWLRYDRIADEKLRADYSAATTSIVLATPTGADSPTVAAAREELTTALRGLIASEPKIIVEQAASYKPLAAEAFTLVSRNGTVTITGGSDVAVLYGSFALLRRLQLNQPIDPLEIHDAPKISRRMLNHWDNLDGTIERGYAGRSLWQWDELPGKIDPRYRDYARALASVGLNGTVPINVNSNLQFLTPGYLKKIAALADVFRPYGIRVYLTAKFSSPVELGKLKTADPLDAAVITWWREKTEEIYRAIPDFGGYLIKANSEGQPGPQTYGRTHADGANLLADAVAPHGGIVIWRAFVYDAAVADDRAKQAYHEFTPLDGQFRANVVVQVKNGPIDFMPREPFHPLFGAMPQTPLALEVQITQEYLGGSSELCFLAPMWKEVLDADTFRPAPGSTVARVIDGSIDHHALTVIAGVANTGTDRNWCGNSFAPANWYAFGRLAWDPALTSAQIAEEWTRQTFSNDARVVSTIVPMLLASRETVVNYSMPLGLHHIMARSHHQGPGPWVTGGRADQTSVYFHRADSTGVGFDRTATGSNAVGQYAPEVASRWADLATCPDEFLLWFHHLPWDYQMRSGKTLWTEICLHYQSGNDTVRGWQKSWATLAGAIDDERFAAGQKLLTRQEHEARIWRDVCTQYFATFSKLPLPPGYESPEHPLEFYRQLPAPFTAATVK